jgi:hypothetical protein
MIYMECPNKTDLDKKSLFLAGGISGCRNWQAEVVAYTQSIDYILYNPRREYYDITNQDIAEEQITWEEEMMRKADFIAFYFCRETICPITLYELGVYNMTKKPIIVGMDQDYSRRLDIEIQTKLKRPQVKFVYGTQGLISGIKLLLKEGI